MVLWCIAHTESLPDDFDEEFAVCSVGLEDGAQVTPEDLDFAVLGRVAAEDDREAEQLVSAALKTLGFGVMLEYHAIAYDAKYMIRPERRAARELSEGDVSFSSGLVGFKRGDQSAKRAVDQVIQEAMTRRPWQFWC